VTFSLSLTYFRSQSKGVDERADRPAGGTWLGVSKLGRVGGITNFHTPASKAPAHVGTRGRGTLVGDFLRQEVGTPADNIEDYVKAIQKERHEYGAFTVMLWQLRPKQEPPVECWAVTNVEDNNPPFVEGIAQVPAGVHVLTNGPLNVDWFKAQHGKQQFEAIVQRHKTDRGQLVANFLDLLKDTTLPPPQADGRLPPGPRLRELSSINVYHPNIPTAGEYGTRAHTIILVDQNFHVYFEEHQRMEDGSWKKVSYEFDVTQS